MEIRKGRKSVFSSTQEGGEEKKKAPPPSLRVKLKKKKNNNVGGEKGKEEGAVRQSITRMEKGKGEGENSLPRMAGEVYDRRNGQKQERSWKTIWEKKKRDLVRAERKKRGPVCSPGRKKKKGKRLNSEFDWVSRMQREGREGGGGGVVARGGGRTRWKRCPIRREQFECPCRSQGEKKKKKKKGGVRTTTSARTGGGGKSAVSFELRQSAPKQAKKKKKRAFLR